MAQIMSTKRWLKMTQGGTFAKRGPTMRAVDAALDTYHANPSVENLAALKARLDAWKKKKGAGWRKTNRNRRNVVVHLDQELNDPASTLRRDTPTIRIPTPDGPETWTGADAEALLKTEREALAKSLFGGKRLEWRSGIIKKLGNQKSGMVMGPRSLVSGSRTIANPTSMAAQVAKNREAGQQVGGTAASVVNRVGSSPIISDVQRAAGVFDMALKEATNIRLSVIADLVPPEVLEPVELILEETWADFVGELAASLTPLIGVISSGGTVLWGCFKTSQTHYKLDRARLYTRKAVIQIGGPAAAAAMLVKLLERERNYKAVALQVNGAAFAAKCGALALGDPVIANAATGLAASIAKLTNHVRMIVRDVLEQRAGNKIIQRGTIDMTVFQTCPILGAYFVALAPPSALLNLMVEDYGKIGWMDDVERLIQRHIAPLKKAAKEVVKAHRFVIPSLQTHAGLVDANPKSIEAAMERAAVSPRTGIGPDNVVSVLAEYHRIRIERELSLRRATQVVRQKGSRNLLAGMDDEFEPPAPLTRQRGSRGFLGSAEPAN